LSDHEGLSILENLTASLDNIDPLLKSCALNALKVARAVSSAKRIIQDEYKLSDFAGQQIPKLLVAEQFHELKVRGHLKRLNELLKTYQLKIRNFKIANSLTKKPISLLL
jgi:hypothetical protein